MTNIFRSTYALYNVKILLHHETSDRNKYQGYLLKGKCSRCIGSCNGLSRPVP